MKTNISGFPEYTPSEQLAFDAITTKIRKVYQSFGYVPLETAAVERIETLTSKGIDSKEVYALRRLNAVGDDGDKDIALRFDLTVPLARYVAQNYADLTFPFRRYQCQPVWRGERAQKGRYRQFHQFDLDVIADGKLPIEADAEIIAAAYTALRKILPSGTRFLMRLNNRKLLTGILQLHGFKTDQQQAEAIKIIDSAEKVGIDTTIQSLANIVDRAQAEEVYETLTSKNQLQRKCMQSPLAQEGWDELMAVQDTIHNLLGKKYKSAYFIIDATIARGLDYYTGTVVETLLLQEKSLGSICSGGRYDNLTASLSERNLPGVGISIGISRLAAWLMDQPRYKNLPSTTAKFVVAGPQAAQACHALREAGIPCEQALGDKSLGTHFQTAQKRGLKYGIMADTEYSVRSFNTRAQAHFSTLEDLIKCIKNRNLPA